MIKGLLNASESFGKVVKYRLINRGNKYLYCRCRKCPSTLTYRAVENQTGFTLVKFNNNHRHSVDKSTLNSNANSNFIQSLPSSLGLKASKAITLHTLPTVSPSQFLLLLSKSKKSFFVIQWACEKARWSQILDSKWSFFSKYEWIAKLDDHSKQQNEGNVQKIRKYGWIWHNLSYYQRKEGVIYKLGAFIGISSSKHLVPFGLVVTLTETK